MFSEPRDQRQMRMEPHSYSECFAQYPGGSGFDQIPPEYQPFGGPHSRDREMNYSRNHGDLREGFFHAGHQYPQDSALMNPHCSQERSFTASAGYQKEDDLEYDRGFPLQVPSSDRDSGPGSGLQDSNARKALGPMFVIGQNNPPPAGGRRW